MSVFLGDNAQGKSNLLEAIYFISTGKSFRTNKPAEMVQWGQQQFDICCEVDFCDVSHRIEASIGENGSRYLLDGKPRRGSSIFGNFKAVVFANEDLDVVRQEPATRRRFFDLFFTQIDSEYGKRLDDVNRVVRSRNQLLKLERFDDLSPWNDLLIREGSWLIARRKEFLGEFEQAAMQHHRSLSDAREALTLQYKTHCEGDSREAVAAAMARKLAEHALHERALKTTLTGPHRDDYEISIGNKSVRQFGSEGQKRSAMLSLRLAQWRFLEKRFGEQPMILLDDVLGELDARRQMAFMDLVTQSGAQAFIALTQATEYLHSVSSAMFRISAGRLVNESNIARA